MIDKSSIPSSVYGPVDSWRLGRSLGIDILCVDSICSFECVYCQLGKINRVTAERGLFVTTGKILSDLSESDWKNCDVITFSGSGEPTLALNLGEAIRTIKVKTKKPVVVLTNSTLLHLSQVRSELSEADKVFCKLDAWSDDVLRRVDRPHSGISLKSLLSGLKLFRDEYSGFMAIQTMLLRVPQRFELKRFSEILQCLAPDEIQINIPSRPVPREYFTECRGNDYSSIRNQTSLKTISRSELEEIQTKLSELTHLPVVAR